MAVSGSQLTRIGTGQAVGIKVTILAKASGVAATFQAAWARRVNIILGADNEAKRS